MFKIRDGREYFYQWDLDRELIVNDSTIKEVHYCNRTDDCSLVVDVKDGIAPVPNQILQHSFDVRAFAYDGNATLHEQVFKVKPRTKPSDYVYTETEVKSYEYLESKLTEIEEKGFSEETVSKAVHDYLEGNEFVDKEYVDDAVSNVKVDLTGYATEKYVDEAIDAIPVPNVSAQINVHNTSSTAHSDIRKAIPTKVSQLANDAGYITEVPEVNLDGYATEEFVINKVNQAALGGEDVVDLSIYATKDYVDEALKDVDADVDLTGYATESYVQEQIAAIPETDLSGLATETYVQEQIQAIPEVDLSDYAKKTDIPDTSTFISAIPEEYVTETELAAKGYLTEHQSLEDYAKKTDIPVVPTKVSAFENDKGYLTEHQSLAGYATEQFVTDAIDAIPEVDLTPYAKTTDIPTKVSQLTNDKNYLTAVPSEYVTESELLAKKYATQTQLNNEVTALEGDIADVESTVTKLNNTVADMNETVTDMSTTKADKSYVDNHVSTINTTVSNLSSTKADKSYVNSEIAEVEQSITNLSSTKADKTYVDDKVQAHRDDVDDAVATLTESVNTLSTTKADKTYVDTEIDKVEAAIPTKVSQLENDSKYTTRDYIQENYYDKSDIQLADNVVIGTPFYVHRVGYDSGTFQFDRILTTTAEPFTFESFIKYLAEKGSTTVRYTSAYSEGGPYTDQKAVVGFGDYAFVDSATDTAIQVHCVSLVVTESAENVLYLNQTKELNLYLSDASKFYDIVEELGETVLTEYYGDGSGNVDLSNYYTKSQTDAAIKDAIDNLDIPEGGTTDLSNYYTKTEVDTKLESCIDADTLTYYDTRLKEFVAETYAAKTDIPTVPTKVSELENDSGYLTAHQDLSDYAKKSDIPDTSSFLTAIPDEYVTDSELTAKGYLTEHQSLEGYAKTSDIPDVSAYQTEAQVLALIQANMPASGDEVSY